MTINSTNRLAGPFSGNGAATAFPFTFKVFAAADLQVVRTTSGTDTTLTLNADYTVSLNSDQNANPGGTVTLILALAVGSALVVTSQLPYLQQTDLTNQGGFYPKVIADALDRQTIFAQQLDNTARRSLRAPVSDGNADLTLVDAEARAGKVMAFDEAGAPVMSNLTLQQIEEQPALAIEAVEQATEQAQIATEQAGIATEKAEDATAQKELARLWATQPSGEVEPGLGKSAYANALEAGVKLAATILQAAAAAGSASSAQLFAERAAAAKGLFASTTDALSKGVYALASLVGGSGGTNGTFDLAFSGGGGTGAAGRFTVAGGAVTSAIITANGRGYTSAPTVSFAASAGLAGASAAAVIANNTDSGETFITYYGSGSNMMFDLWLNSGGVAVYQNSQLSAYGQEDQRLLQVMRSRYNAAQLFEGALTDPLKLNWISEMFYDAAQFQVTYTGGAARNADGSYTIPAGGSVAWSLHTADPFSRGVWKGTVTSPRYFAVYQPDPTNSGLTFKVNAFAPNANLATFSQVLPGLWEGVMPANANSNNGVVFTVTNGGASSITIAMPYAGQSPVYAIDTFNQIAPAKPRPVRDWVMSFPISNAGSRNLAERQCTSYLDSVNGSDAAAGTLYAPKQNISALPTLAAQAHIGVYRGSLFRKSLKTGGSGDVGVGNNVSGVLLRDVRQGRTGAHLPIVSALNTIPNGSFVDNADGTYSYTFTGEETLVNDGYRFVYAVEVATAKEVSNPITCSNMLAIVTSLAAVQATAGTQYIQSLGSNQWKVTIRPTDSLAPGSGAYRYEVTTRNMPADWFQYERDGQMEGFWLVGSNNGYGSIGGPKWFDLDRTVIQHASIHGAVIGGGTVSRCIFYGNSASRDSIACTFYKVNTDGLSYVFRDSFVYEPNSSGVYSHNTSGTGYEDGRVERSYFSTTVASLTAKVPACTAISGNNVKRVVYDGNYINGGFSTGIAPAPSESMVVTRNIIRDCPRPFNPGRLGAGIVKVKFQHNIVRTRSWSDASDVNRRGASIFLGGTTAQYAYDLSNNLIHMRATDAGGVANDKVATYKVASGKSKRNIIVLDVPAGGTVNYMGADKNNTANLDSDYNLIVCNYPRSKMIFNTDPAGGGAANKDWFTYVSQCLTEQNSLWIDVSADPRGIKAVFVDPDNGDYRFADTEKGRVAATYCITNQVGPEAIISRWPTVPTADEAYLALREL